MSVGCECYAVVEDTMTIAEHGCWTALRHWPSLALRGWEEVAGGEEEHDDSREQEHRRHSRHG